MASDELVRDSLIQRLRSFIKKRPGSRYKLLLSGALLLTAILLSLHGASNWRQAERARTDHQSQALQTAAAALDARMTDELQRIQRLADDLAGVLDGATQAGGSGLPETQLRALLEQRVPDLLSYRIQRDTAPPTAATRRLALVPFGIPPQVEATVGWRHGDAHGRLTVARPDNWLTQLLQRHNEPPLRLLLSEPDGGFVLAVTNAGPRLRPYGGHHQPQDQHAITDTDWTLATLASESGSGDHRWRRQLLVGLALFLAIGSLMVAIAYIARRELWRRFGAERARASSEERLQQALRASDEGLWDYDLVQRRLYLSQEWRHLAGSSAATAGATRLFWRRHIHPDDLQRVRKAFLALLSGVSERFESEFRVGPGDEPWRWVQTRGRVISRDPSGRATRALGIISDVSERRRATDILRRITEGTAATTGSDFYQHLTRCLATTLKMRCAYVARLERPTDEQAKVLAMWLDQGFLPTFSYSLRGTPCANVIGKRSCVHHAGVSQRFRDDEMLNQLHAEAYLGVPLFDSHGTPLGLLAVIDDKPLADTQTASSVLTIFASRVSAELERQQAEAELYRQKERAQVTLHSIGDAVITTDETGHIEYLNPVAEQLTGWPLQQARGMALGQAYRVIDQDSGQPLPDPVPRCIEGETATSSGARSVLVSRNGERHAIQDSAAPIRATDGTVSGVVLVFNDVSEARRMASEMAYQASHDPLTGLVNRREFERRLEMALDSARSKGMHHALCYIDLDQFKVVNDTAGHKAGDELLRQVSTLLQNHIRSRDTLARVGGDEFTLLLENCPLDTAEGIADALIASVRDLRFGWQDQSFRIGASIGLVPAGADSGTVEELLARADAACYQAKDSGRNRIHVDAMDANTPAQRHEEVQRTTRITRAIEHNRFQLFAQAIEPLGSGDGRQRFEILLRLEADDGSLIEPGGFLPAAERFGYMPLLDRWVINHLCEEYHQHLERSPRLELGINLAAASLNDPGLPDFIRETFSSCHTPMQNICFEIAERAAISTLDRTTTFVRTLREHGCRLALDNFAGGLASFAMLRALPIDYLKLDGSFVANLATDPVDHALVSSVNQVAHLLDIKTVAEHAENPDQIAALTRLGVDFAQGYAVGRPQPLADVIDTHAAAS